MLALDETDGVVTFTVRVVPRATKTAAAGVYDGMLKVRVAAPPVDGAANEELMRFLARALKLPVRSIEIVGGHRSKTKVVRIAAPCAESLRRMADDTERAK